MFCTFFDISPVLNIIIIIILTILTVQAFT